jgi:hypothetical protein
MGDEIEDAGDGPDNVEWKPLIPFLEGEPLYAFGVEFGMWYASCRTKPEHAQHVRTENESQMTLTCSRLGWEVAECRPWEDGPPDNGWVFLRVLNPSPVEELT